MELNASTTALALPSLCLGDASLVAFTMLSKDTVPVALANAPSIAVFTMGFALFPRLCLIAMEVASTVATPYGRSKSAGFPGEL